MSSSLSSDRISKMTTCLNEKNVDVYTGEHTHTVSPVSVKALSGFEMFESNHTVQPRMGNQDLDGPASHP